MSNATKFYIDGAWVDPSSSRTLEVIDPSTEAPIATVALADQADVDRAVAAAKRAFESFSQTSVADRIALLERILVEYQKRSGDLAEALMSEMGSPRDLAENAHVPCGTGQFAVALDALRTFEFEEKVGTSSVVYEPIGVVGLITPWNWPMLLIASKVAPALAAGCTMVLKPSELAPLNAVIFAEILDAAGVPAGVFNLVNGDGPGAGVALSSHPDVDMVSFTGSTRAGIEVAKNAAPTVKRVHQELGGKSANILLDDADLAVAIPRDLRDVYANSGQSCNAGSRFLVPSDRLADAITIAAEAADATVVGEPAAPGTQLGPLVSQAGYDKVQRLIQSAIDEGATVVAGGLGRPAGLDHGYFVRPTVIAGVTNDMAIAKEEIFGPVITISTYDGEDDAVAKANDTVYGLSGFVSSADTERARRVARRLRTGMVHINGAGLDFNAPFGGYKQSGNGREYAVFGIREFLEAKAVFGDNA